MADPAMKRAAASEWYYANRARVLATRAEHYQANREALIAYAKDWRRQYYREAREKVFDHYGRACACCGTSDKLTIDHIDGGGTSHRRELFGGRNKGGERFYVWLIREGFPDGYQALCGPCNGSKGRYGSCRRWHGDRWSLLRPGASEAIAALSPAARAEVTDALERVAELLRDGPRDHNHRKVALDDITRQLNG